MTDLLTTSQAAALAGVRPATWRQWQRRGHVPEPDLRPNPRLSMWRRAVVERVIEQRRAT